MKTLLLLLLAQVVVSDLPPPLPSVVIVDGRVGVVTLNAAACAKPLRALGTTWHCRPDNTLILAVPIGHPFGPWGIMDAAGQPVAVVDVGMAAWPQEHRPAQTGRPAPADRLQADRTAKERAYAAHTDPRWASYHLHGPLGAPLGVGYRTTDPFGLRRFYGGATEPQLHSGTDMAAPKSGAWDTNSPDALAVTGGVVVLSQELWDSGKTVIVYHGDAVFMSYSHLDSFAVRVGDLVFSGAKLGTVGGSIGEGRVGKHLHLVMRVNDILVDPLDAIATLNETLP